MNGNDRNQKNPYIGYSQESSIGRIGAALAAGVSGLACLYALLTYGDAKDRSQAFAEQLRTEAQRQKVYSAFVEAHTPRGVGGIDKKTLSIPVSGGTRILPDGTRIRMGGQRSKK